MVRDLFFLLTKSADRKNEVLNALLPNTSLVFDGTKNTSLTSRAILKAKL